MLKIYNKIYQLLINLIKVKEKINKLDKKIMFDFFILY